MLKKKAGKKAPAKKAPAKKAPAKKPAAKKAPAKKPAAKKAPAKKAPAKKAPAKKAEITAATVINAARDAVRDSRYRVTIADASTKEVRLSKNTFKFFSDVQDILWDYSASHNGETIKGYTIVNVPAFKRCGKSFKGRKEIVILVSKIKSCGDKKHTGLKDFIDNSRPMKRPSVCGRDTTIAVEIDRLLERVK